MEYYKSFKRFIPIALVGVIFVASVVVLELEQITYMGRIINEGIVPGRFDVVLQLALIMGALALVALCCGIVGVSCASISSNGFAVSLREKVYAKIQTFSTKNVTRFQGASLITRLTNDINFIQNTVMMCLRMLVRAPMMLVTSSIFIIRMSKEISLLMIVPMIILAISLVIIILKGAPRFIVLQESLDRLNRRIQEALINIRVIKSFVRERDEDMKFETSNDEYMQKSVHAQSLMMLINPLMMFVLNITTVVMLYVCSLFVVKLNLLEVGNIVVILTYVRFTLFSLMMISQILTMVSRSKASIARVSAVLNAHEPITSQADALMVESLRGDIVFNHVSFKYYEDQMRNTLTDLNFTIKQGEHFGIIGSTGSGKSTLVQLLGRLIEPSDGEINIDGKNILALDLHQLRSHVGFVPQKNVLFSGTIAQNLCLGHPDAHPDTIKKAAATANIAQFIEQLPEQYETVLTQGGTNLSGGQKQRMCIARALMVDPDILILDDSTSALDGDTEARINRDLHHDYEGLTIISIAQKISSVAKCDRILVLDDGQMVGLDTHAQLLENNAIYQEIYQSQMQKGGLS